MKQLLALCFALILSANLLSVRALALEVPDIISKTAVLMDAETGQVLYEKNQGQRMYPASTTKIMTGLLAVENCSPEEIAKVSASAVDIKEWDSANIALQENEEMSVDGLLYAMMMPSANDASNVLAEHITGSQSAFADMMNKRAESIGAESTHFANAHGLHDPNHYTTAYDLALITREAIRNKTFMKYFGTPKRTIPPTNLNPYERPFTNYQYMLVDSSEFYDSAVTGGKVGYTHEAGHTMSTVAEKDGRRLICVVMKSQNRGDKFADTKKLLDFGFSEFKQIYVDSKEFPGFEEKIIRGKDEIGTVKFRGAKDFKALLHVSAPSSAIRIRYSSKNAGDARNSEGYAEFYADTGNAAIPSLLGRQMLDRSVTVYPPNSSEAILSELSAIMNESPWLIPLVLFFAVSAIFLMLKLADKIFAVSREKRRQKRLAELQAAETARYQGPVPAVGKRFLAE